MDDKQDFDLAMEYIRAHPVLSKSFQALLAYVMRHVDPEHKHTVNDVVRRAKRERSKEEKLGSDMS